MTHSGGNRPPKALPPGGDWTALEQALRESVDGEVRFDAGSRGAYAPDASDAPELMPQDEDVQRLARQFRTLSELLVNDVPDWRPPSLARAATVQTHCPQHAVLKDDGDRELMCRARMDSEVLDEGCCGLAGNFGFERGHYDVSMKIGENGVLPAVRAASPSSMIIADGFSCRTQISQGDTGRQAIHLAEALALALEGPAPADHPEKLVPRPALRTHDTQLTIATAALMAAVAAMLAVIRRRRR